MRLALRVIWSGLLTLVILGSGAWGTLFIWYAAPGGTWASGMLAGLFATFATAAVLAIRRRQSVVPLAYALAFVALVVAFDAIQPHTDRDWAFDVAHPLTAEISGDRVTLHNVRDFDWRSQTDAVRNWETRVYDLGRLDSLDVINSYWSGRTIAHTLVSFGFLDGRHVAVSIEIRRERDETYSDLAGFFRRYELITIGADERDIVRLRTTVRREDVELYAIQATPEQIRALFVDVLRQANEVASEPTFYNSLVANCTTVLFGAARTVDPNLPLDWRIILNGYLPDYLYDNRLVDTRLSFRELRARGSVSQRGREAGDSEDFSARIREGIPDPRR